MNEYATFVAICIVFAFVIGVLWIFVPFILMGANKRADRLLAEAKKSNQLLTDILSAILKAQGKQP